MMSIRELVRAAAEAAWNESMLANDCPNCSNEPALNPYRKVTEAKHLKDDG